MENSLNLIDLNLNKKELTFYKKYFLDNTLIIRLDNHIHLKKNKSFEKIENGLNIIIDTLQEVGISQFKINLDDFVHLNNGIDFFLKNLEYYDLMNENLFLYTFQLMHLKNIFGEKINLFFQKLNKIKNVNLSKNSERFEELNGGKMKGGLRIKNLLGFIFLLFLFQINLSYSNFSSKATVNNAVNSLSITNSRTQQSNSQSKAMITRNFSLTTQSTPQINMNLSPKEYVVNSNEFQLLLINNGKKKEPVQQFSKEQMFFFMFFIINYMNGKTLKESIINAYEKVYVNEKTQKSEEYKSLKDFLLGKKKKSKNNESNNKCRKCECKCECKFS